MQNMGNTESANHSSMPNSSIQMESGPETVTFSQPQLNVNAKPFQPGAHLNSQATPFKPTYSQVVMPNPIPHQQPVQNDPVMHPTITVASQTTSVPVTNVIARPIINIQHNNSNSRPIFDKNFVHPFMELIKNNASNMEMIDTMALFMGVSKAGEESFYTVDQMDFIIPVLQVFSYAVCNDRAPVARWIMENFVLLDVSYDDNFCYNGAIKWNYPDIADEIALHESFSPSTSILQDLMRRGRYDLIKKCINAPALSGLLKEYKDAFIN
jgi:hypothetical protein